MDAFEWGNNITDQKIEGFKFLGEILIVEISFKNWAQSKKKRHQSHVEKIFLVPDVAEGVGHVGVEVVPPKAVLLRRWRPHLQKVGRTLKFLRRINPFPFLHLESIL